MLIKFIYMRYLILLVMVLLLVGVVIAAPVEIPWKQELSNTSSGYTDKEAAYKVHYYLKEELKDWEGLCKVGNGAFRSEYGKIRCQQYYPEVWDCTGTAIAYCDLE